VIDWLIFFFFFWFFFNHPSTHPTSALTPPVVIAIATPTPDGTAIKKPGMSPKSDPRDSISAETSLWEVCVCVCVLI
jgi:hypothetical protein